MLLQDHCGKAAAVEEQIHSCRLAIAAGLVSLAQGLIDAMSRLAWSSCIALTSFACQELQRSRLVAILGTVFHQCNFKSQQQAASRRGASGRTEDTALKSTVSSMISVVVSTAVVVYNDTASSAVLGRFAEGLVKFTMRSTMPITA